MTAPAQLDADSTDLLVKFCRLFGSDHIGERAAAAAKAHNLVCGLGLDWGEIIRPARHSGHYSDRSYTGTWRQNLALAVRFQNDLTPWETGFIASMRTKLDATPKQRATLVEIAARLRVRGRE